ncbi:MAG: DNA-binding protein WhiA [Clostridia bacterium]|nr:DNA-binding protein WhiA [Clostridia bacterium]MBR6809945.1 DNA-binding protein WhiA [Clostridia bacterium]
MSFSSTVKEELLRALPEKGCCMLSEISAYTQSIASLRLAGGGRVKVVYETENSALAKRIFLLLKKRLEITASLSFTRYARLGGRRGCILTVNEQDSRHLLVSLRMLREEESGSVFKGVPRAAMTRRCCRAAFVRAAFLGAGSVQDPEHGYHLEFVTSQSKAEILTGILEKSNLSWGMTDRRGSKLVYIRKGDDVVSCLALMGAHQALMEMENVRILRASRNQANRATNCDQANLNKQLSAGARQAAAITAYSLRHSLGGLPKDLQEIGRLRMLNPDVSLEELGKMLSEPVGKSGANHKMRKLMQIIDADEKA